MLLGELLTLAQQQLPVKIVVFNNAALGFVEVEMKAAGIVNFGTDWRTRTSPRSPQAVGLHGERVEPPGELEAALRRALRATTARRWSR